MTPASALHSRYDTVIREVNAGNTTYRLLAVRDTNALVDAIDPAAFQVDERFPYWADLWISSVALAEYLSAIAARKKVLELGCGLGLAGIAAARAGASVTMTDIEPDALLFAAENVALNLEPEQRTRIAIAAMDWRSPDLHGLFDLVIGADILYERRSFTPLLSLLDRALAQGGSVVLADPDRAVGRDFFDLARSVGWTVSTKPVRHTWNGVSVTVTLNTLRPRHAGRSAGA